MRLFQAIALSSLVMSFPAAASADPEDEETTEGGYAEEVPSEDEARSDHEEFAGFGLGFQGARVVPSTLAGNPTLVIQPNRNVVLSVAADEMVVPLFGIRHWFSELAALEVGLGFSAASGTAAQRIPNPNPAIDTNVESDEPTIFAVAGHLAVPLSVYSISHFNVLLIPEMDLGYTSSTIEAFHTSTTGEPLDLRLTGLLFGAGLRLGAELSFGFFEVPQLALQASFGFRYEYRSHAGKIGDAEMTITEHRFGTSWYEDPWASLAASVGLYYYF